MSIDCDEVSVSGRGNAIEVTMDNPDVSDVVAELGADSLLEAIGREAAIKYFDIEEVDE